MPAINMGAAGGANAQVAASAYPVICDPASGPTNSPFDARRITGWTTNGMPTYANNPTNFSTGALCTGIGIGLGLLGNIVPTQAEIRPYSFTDDYIPGTSTPAPANATLSTYLYIGGGKSDAAGKSVPYGVNQILGFGNGASRDAGAGPVYTGFGMKMVTAAGAVAQGAAIETGFVNRSGRALVTGNSVFGSSVAASPAFA